MQRLERQIRITSESAVSSVWGVPDDYSRDIGVILGHGAGSDMHAAFLVEVTDYLAARGILTVRFNFPYRERGRKAPDRAPVLEAAWRAVVETVRDDRELAPEHLFLGGKSMGGRIASHLAAAGEPCAGLVFLGYPLHAPGRTERLRSEHLPAIACPMLFVQGTRDRLCDLHLLNAVLKSVTVPVTLHIVDGGDHSFKVLKRSGRQPEDVMREILAAVHDWIEAQSRS